MTSPIEVNKGVCLAGACAKFQEFDKQNFDRILTDDLHEYEQKRAAAYEVVSLAESKVAECMGHAGCILANAEVQEEV